MLSQTNFVLPLSRECRNEKEILSRTSVSVRTNHSAAFWEASQLSGKLLRHTLLRQLHVKNVLGIDIQDDLTLTV